VTLKLGPQSNAGKRCHKIIDQTKTEEGRKGGGSGGTTIKGGQSTELVAGSWTEEGIS